MRVVLAEDSVLLREGVARLLEESVAFAEASPFPTLDQVTTDVYVRER